MIHHKNSCNEYAEIPLSQVANLRGQLRLNYIRIQQRSTEALDSKTVVSQFLPICPHRDCNSIGNIKLFHLLRMRKSSAARTELQRSSSSRTCRSRVHQPAYCELFTMRAGLKVEFFFADERAKFQGHSVRRSKHVLGAKMGVGLETMSIGGVCWHCQLSTSEWTGV